MGTSSTSIAQLPIIGYPARHDPLLYDACHEANPVLITILNGETVPVLAAVNPKATCHDAMARPSGVTSAKSAAPTPALTEASSPPLGTANRQIATTPPASRQSHQSAASTSVLLLHKGRRHVLPPLQHLLTAQRPHHLPRIWCRQRPAHQLRVGQEAAVAVALAHCLQRADRVCVPVSSMQGLNWW